MSRWFIAWTGVAAGCVLEVEESTIHLGNDNVEACEAWRTSLQCADFDFDELYDERFCGAYEDLSCDVSNYFACLSDGAGCEDGIYTPALGCEIPACD